MGKLETGFEQAFMLPIDSRHSVRQIDAEELTLFVNGLEARKWEKISEHRPKPLGKKEVPVKDLVRSGDGLDPPWLAGLDRSEDFDAAAGPLIIFDREGQFQQLPGAAIYVRERSEAEAA